MSVGPLGRLGHWTATHFRAVAATWVLITIAFGVFAPRAEHALSGAGWEATGSESVKARNLVEQHFAGLGSYGLMVVVHAPAKTVDDPAFASAVANVERTLAADESITPWSLRGPASPSRPTGTRRWSRPAPAPTRTTWSARPTI